MENLSYLATALVLSAVYYISKPKLRGQYLIVSADITWLAYSLFTKQWALAIQSVVLLIIGISAIKNWKKKGIEF
jgi:hydrogenase-4 membrane subunit HyfE